MIIQITIPEIKELKGVAQDVLHLLEIVLNAHHYSSRVRAHNVGFHLSPQLIKFFSWVILVAELKAAKNECPKCLENLLVIKRGYITTRGWSWRMVLEKALRLLEVEEVICYAQPNPCAKRSMFLCMEMTFADGSSVSMDQMNPEDLIEAVGKDSLLKLCELGFEDSLGKPDLFSVPGEIAFIGATQHWQTLKEVIVGACLV